MNKPPRICRFVTKNGNLCQAKLKHNQVKFCARHRKMYEKKMRKIEQRKRSSYPVFEGEQTVSKKDYRAYLQSDEWKKKAAKKKEENPNCNLCNQKKNLHVHHRTYVRCGSERDDDLIVLCGNCHEMFHTHYTYSEYTGCFVRIEYW